MKQDFVPIAEQQPKQGTQQQKTQVNGKNISQTAYLQNKGPMILYKDVCLIICQTVYLYTKRSNCCAQGSRPNKDPFGYKS